MNNVGEVCPHNNKTTKQTNGAQLVKCADCGQPLYRIDPTRPKPDLTKRKGKRKT